MVDQKVNATDAFIQRSKKLILKGNEIECVYQGMMCRLFGVLEQ
jgi:hypothetical protein